MRASRRAAGGLLLALLALVLGLAAAAAGKSTGSGGGAFAKYYKAMQKAPHHLLDLDDPKFDAMILMPGAKRSFPVFLLFTAANPRYGCTPCHMIAKIMSDAAASYLLRNARLPADKQLPPVAFAVVDVESAPATFREKMQLETVPHVYLLEAHTAYRFPLGPDGAVHFDYEEGLDGLLALLKERAGVAIDPVPDLGATVHGAAALAVLLAIAVYLFVDQWEWTKAAPFNRWLWLCVSYAVFTTAVGGMVYCVIRTPPPFGFEGEGRLSLFAMRSSQDQFVAEGLVMGLINLCCGLSFVATYYFASKSRYRIVQFIGLNLSLAAAAYFMHRLFGLYGQKTRWYDVQQTLEPQVATFLFGNMKKSSGLLRRLLRVTQLWLYDFKDWPSFSKTATNLVVNYAKRQLAAVGLGGGAGASAA